MKGQVCCSRFDARATLSPDGGIADVLMVRPQSLKVWDSLLTERVLHR